jgi:hypothetical protein
VTQPGNFEYIYFGDPEALTIQILKDSSEMQALQPTSIADNMIGYNFETDKWVEVGMQGGSYKYRQQKRPRIDITTYAPTREEAYDLGATAQAVMFKYQGSSYHAFGLIYIACQIETDLFKAYDKETSAIRYVQALRLILKAQ